MGAEWEGWYNGGIIRFDGRCAFLDTNFLSIRQNIAPIARLPINATHTYLILKQCHPSTNKPTELTTHPNINLPYLPTY